MEIFDTTPRTFCSQVLQRGYLQSCFCKYAFISFISLWKCSRGGAPRACVDWMSVPVPFPWSSPILTRTSHASWFVVLVTYEVGVIKHSSCKLPWLQEPQTSVVGQFEQDQFRSCSWQVDLPRIGIKAPVWPGQELILAQTWKCHTTFNAAEILWKQEM